MFLAPHEQGSRMKIASEAVIQLALLFITTSWTFVYEYSPTTIYSSHEIGL